MLTWWTFGGLCANRSLAESLKAAGNWQVTHDNLMIKIQSHVKPSELDETIAQIRQSSQATLSDIDPTDYMDELKFSVCLPNDLIIMMMGLRLSDEEAVGQLLSRPIKQVRKLEASQKIEPESAV
jgi:hypothetical protein